jgi:hypothetical protein
MVITPCHIVFVLGDVVMREEEADRCATCVTVTRLYLLVSECKQVHKPSSQLHQYRVGSSYIVWQKPCSHCRGGWEICGFTMGTERAKTAEHGQQRLCKRLERKSILI